MDLKQFRYFTAIVETGSYARASEACNVSQPAISASITLLEADVGAPLLERGSFGARPTELGKLLYKRAKLVLAELERTRAELATIKSGEGGTLVIGVSPMTECALAPAIVEEFTRNWPTVQVTVVTALSGELFERLAHGELDLVFNSPPQELEYPRSLEIELLTTAQDVVLAASSHPICDPKNREMAMLSQYKWILTGRPLDTTRRFFEVFQRNSVPLPGSLLRMDSFAMIARAVARQRFLYPISPLLFPYFSLLAGGDGVEAVKIDEFSFARRVCLATRKGSILGKASTEMIAIIRRHVSLFDPYAQERGGH